MTFRVGERVICVDASPHCIPKVSVLTAGRIYTVRGVEFDQPLIGICLEEVVNCKTLCFYRGEHVFAEPTYRATRFRKLVTRTQEQDTEAFLRIANSVDPIVIADLYERDMSEAEAQLNERWTR